MVRTQPVHPLPHPDDPSHLHIGPTDRWTVTDDNNADDTRCECELSLYGSATIIESDYTPPEKVYCSPSAQP